MSLIPSEVSLSLVFLMYNEEENIDRVLTGAIAYCERRLGDWELLVIDDGSSDRSAAIVETRAEVEPRIRLIRHGHNQGMGAGMASGIRHAEKEMFVYFPADGQVAPEELDKMLPLLGDADIVLTTYSNNRELVRRVISRGLRVFMKTVVGISFELQGLYLFPTALGRALVDQVEATTFFFSFELIHRAIESGATITNTEIICLPREEGESKVFNLRRIRRVATEVLRYARRRRSSKAGDTGHSRIRP